MKKLTWTFFVSVLAVLFAACAPTTTAVDDAGVAGAEVAGVGAGTCEGLTGNYVARDFGFTSVADPNVRETFAGADYRLSFNNDTFTSAFTNSDFGVLEQTGTFGFEGNALTLGDAQTGAFLPGGAVGAQRFRCEATATGFSLTSEEPVGYDFGGGALEDATFEADFERF